MTTNTINKLKYLNHNLDNRRNGMLMEYIVHYGI